MKVRLALTALAFVLGMWLSHVVQLAVSDQPRCNDMVPGSVGACVAESSNPVLVVGAGVVAGVATFAFTRRTTQKNPAS